METRQSAKVKKDGAARYATDDDPDQVQNGELVPTVNGTGEDHQDSDDEKQSVHQGGSSCRSSDEDEEGTEKYCLVTRVTLQKRPGMLPPAHSWTSGIVSDIYRAEVPELTEAVVTRLGEAILFIGRRSRGEGLTPGVAQDLCFKLSSGLDWIGRQAEAVVTRMSLKEGRLLAAQAKRRVDIEDLGAELRAKNKSRNNRKGKISGVSSPRPAVTETSTWECTEPESDQEVIIKNWKRLNSKKKSSDSDCDTSAILKFLREPGVLKSMHAMGFLGKGVKEGLTDEFRRDPRRNRRTEVAQRAKAKRSSTSKGKEVMEEDTDSSDDSRVTMSAPPGGTRGKIDLVKMNAAPRDANAEEEYRRWRWHVISHQRSGFSDKALKPHIFRSLSGEPGTQAMNLSENCSVADIIATLDDHFKVKMDYIEMLTGMGELKRRSGEATASFGIRVNSRVREMRRYFPDRITEDEAQSLIAEKFMRGLPNKLRTIFRTIKSTGRILKYEDALEIAREEEEQGPISDTEDTASPDSTTPAPQKSYPTKNRPPTRTNIIRVRRPTGTQQTNPPAPVARKALTSSTESVETPVTEEEVVEFEMENEDVELAARVVRAITDHEKKEKTCYRCKSPDHFIKDCPELPKVDLNAEGRTGRPGGRPSPKTRSAEGQTSQ